ncbi:hypothetical protein [Candidatus Spyradosoma sp. SGI.093]|uniref:hypothetical protein n=1 Tax=Candidatus Spyradosoma sp. SGI.093 TaxID=3420583 RepID=UPI003D072F81
MKKQLRIPKIIPSVLITTAAFGAGVASPNAFAAESEDNDQLKAKLYLEAESAVSERKFDVAVEKYRAFLKLDPNNAEAASRLAEAETALRASDSARTVGKEGAPANEFERVVQHRNAIYREAEAAIEEARFLIPTDPDRALRLLEEIESALPNTPASRDYLDKISVVRQEVLLERNNVDQAKLSEEMSEAQRAAIRENSLAARRSLSRARDERARHMLPEAIKSLDEAKLLLPNISSTSDISKEIDEERALVYSAYFFDMVEKRSAVEAESYLKMVEELLGKDHKITLQLAAFYKEWRATAAAQNPVTLNPSAMRAEKECREALLRGKAQYLYGDYQGALDSYQKALLYMPDNAEAKSMQIRIRRVLANSGEYNHEVTRETMMADVRDKWKLAMPFTAVANADANEEKISPIEAKMARINIPVALRDVPLQRALETLSELSAVHDPVGRGVDIVLNDPETKNPPLINLQMKSQPMNKVLKIMLDTVSYRYDIKDDIVQVSPNVGAAGLDQEEFTVSPKVVARMSGKKSSGDAGGTFGSSGAEATDENSEEQGIKGFFARAGVSWEGDRSLVYDATSNLLIVTQDRKGLDRIRNIIRSLTTAETKQVNIEAKFIEVNSTVLNQVVTNWQLTKGEGENMFVRASTANRTVAGAHGTVSEDSKTRVYTPERSDYTDEDGVFHPGTPARTVEFNQAPPQVTRQPNYGLDAPDTFTGVIGTVGNYDLRLILNALSAQDGCDLMAAPSLTVQSELEATIKIVQLLRWPQSYDDMEIKVNSNNNNNNDNNNSSYGSATVGITPGTPQFDEEATEVGIQMRVVPRVNNTEKSITLELAPEIKEFEGFIEYGGMAVAIAGGIVVTTPAGFFQPVFNLRQVSTTVEVYDGGTVVIGGLTREEIRTVNDKVPILGDLPLIGSAFRSTGKSITKKNLLIFVTANLMARGGGTEDGLFKGVQTGATYSNPSLFISSGPIYREYDMSAIDEEKTAQ